MRTVLFLAACVATFHVALSSVDNGKSIGNNNKARTDDGYQLRVQRSLAPPVCPSGEVWNTCPTVPCEGDNCAKTKDSPQSCPTGIVCSKPRCVCGYNRKRAENGTCIPIPDCPPFKCGKNETYVACSSNCPGEKCSDYINHTKCPPYKIGIVVNCKPACKCKKGYYRDEKGNCILACDCTQPPPKCGKNEVYDDCSSTSCKPSLCSELGYPLNCDKKCKPGCKCKDGHVRNGKDVCIPINTCPSCGGDENAQSGCGTNCGKTCAAIGQKLPIICPLICELNGCDCRVGFYYDPNQKKCVKKEDCTPTCKANEVYSSCINGGCGAKNCSQINKSSICVDPAICRKGCICKEGYLKADNGTCIPKDQCPQNCPGQNEYYEPCINVCGSQKCSDRAKIYHCPIIVPGKCGSSGCRCKPGYLKDAKGVCVPEKECPPPDCPSGEVWDTCPTVPCEGDNCAKTKDSPQSCPTGIVCSKPRCVCGYNRKRAENSTCIPIPDCPPFKCGKNETYVACSSNCPGEKCSDYINQTKCPPYRIGTIVNCKPACKCKKGYYRDEKENCILACDCTQPPPKCGKNEVYDDCSSTICKPNLCSELGYPLNCDKKCKPGCKCKDGHVRNGKDVCIPINTCPSCGGDENAQSGCGTNCGKTCASIGRKSPINCPLICKLNGCDCRNGFYYDPNQKKCVKKEDCTPTCKENEVYSSCINGGCGPKNCSQINKPKICVDRVICKKGCICKEDYLKADNGTCIPKDQCPRCGGDQNSHPGCGVNCGRTCSTYKHKYVACILDCDVDGCDCNEGYVYDPNVKKCVLPKHCTPTCGRNEVYSTCTNGGCSRRNCSQLGKPEICINRTPESCIKGCVCADGYLRHVNGTCVLEKQCPQPECGGDIHAHSGCGVNCGKTCRTYKAKNPVCPRICKVGGCDCNDGYVYDDNLGRCVLPDNCTPETDDRCPGQNEYYDTCISGCSNQSCSDIGKVFHCPLQPAVCREGCRCKAGYWRNADNVCVPESECPPPDCPSGEVWNSCPTVPCEGDNCAKTKDSPQSCPTGIVCSKPRCVCGYNRKRAENGTCIPIPDCPPFKCGKNETYVACSSNCPGEKCSDYINHTKCPPYRIGIVVNCKPACKCKKGYYRDEKGNCILKVATVRQHTLPKTRMWKVLLLLACVAGPAVVFCDGCGGDPNSHPGCGVNCGRTCSTYKTKYVACILECDVDGCDCNDGYVYDPNVKKCVLPKDCTPTCGLHEVYSTCTNGGCSRRNCSQLGKPQICIDRTPESCTKGCVCADGYLRNANGTCVLENQCPQSGCGGDPNAQPGCGINCGQRCSDYKAKNKELICARYACTPDKCDCKDGFVFDNNVKKCVVPEQCTPTCGHNEVFSTCTNGGCSRRNCSQLGKPEVCIKTTPESCTKGCVCADGYLRNANGTCVLENQCPQTGCGGDPNAQPGCGINCGQKCSDYKIQDKQLLCPRIECKPDKCDCKDGFVFDDNLKKCVVPEQCTPTCGLHEVYSTCTNGGCSRRNCSQLGKPQVCIKMTPESCTKGCVCADGYLRNANGTCVLENQCPQTGCGGDPNAKPGCGINCGQKCSDYKIKDKQLLCPRIECKPDKCDCKDGFVFDDNLKKCVVPEQCTPTCGLSEVYSTCTNGGCSRRNCSQLGKPQVCIERTPESCTKGCVCADGYLRNANGVCVLENQCPQPGCGGDPNAQPGCGINCGQKCSDYKIQDKQLLCPRIECKPDKCDCKDGFVFDENLKKCVVPEQCTPTCGLSEVYSTCTNGGCSRRNCSQLGKPQVCIDRTPESCTKGCVCADGYLRNTNGVCVLENQCPQTGCGGDPNAKPGCGINCGRRCSDYKVKNKQLHCPRYACKPDKCDCKDGFVFDDNLKKCVVPEQCTPETDDRCPGQNEYYDTCISGCSNQSCNDIGKVFHCPIQPAVCREGCRCKAGYWRNADDVCVTESECHLWPTTMPLCADGAPTAAAAAEPSSSRAHTARGGSGRHDFVGDDSDDDAKPTTTAKPTSGSSGSDAVASLQTGVTNFNGEFLYERLIAEPGTNLITSPYSVFTPLVQLFLYTTGDALKQLSTVLNVSTKEQIRSAFPEFVSSFEGQTSVNFSSAAKVYSDQKYPLSDGFKKDSVDVVHADAQELDFSKNTEAANTINSWVESQTNNRIHDLIQPSDLSDLTRLVLVNAIYFKGEWHYAFNKDKTIKDADFYLSDGTTKKTKLMYQEGQFNYGEVPELNCTVLQMFYKGDNFSMVVVLPNEKDGLLEVAKNLQLKADFDKVTESLTRQKVKVYLPPFTIETTTDLSVILKQLGVTKIFDTEDSGLSGLLKTSENTYVSKAVQKAFIEVNEEGSEAAAANAMLVATTTAIIDPIPPKEITFRCDRSFLYYIVCNGNVLFAGSVVDIN
ncbi:zonadhesin-like [Cydia strobilella]|uniref:zonadhesin-like n=1 Tax=Cydia strobilella TaxID=1100964 RepID=UPI003007CD2D